MDVYLRYVGNAFLPNVPARDLTEEEVKEYGGEKFLLESGLYVKASVKPHPSGNKIATGGEENK